MECPKCGHRSYVSNSIDKKHFIKRYRACSNKRCKWKFTTKEMISKDWDAVTILAKIKDLVRDVDLGNRLR